LLSLVAAVVVVRQMVEAVVLEDFVLAQGFL
jgi:hypothetical protein